MRQNLDESNGPLRFRQSDRYKVTVEFDTESGDYSLQPFNLSNPGEGIDYHVLKGALRRVFGDFIEQREKDINKATDPSNNN